MKDNTEKFLRMHNITINSLELIRKSGNMHSDTYIALLKVEKRLLELVVINLEVELMFQWKQQT